MFDVFGWVYGVSSSKLVVGKSLRWTYLSLYCSLYVCVYKCAKCNEIEQDYKRFMAAPCFRYAFNVAHSVVPHRFYGTVNTRAFLQLARLNIEFSSLLFVVLTTESRTHFRLISSLRFMHFTDTEANLENQMLVFASMDCRACMHCATWAISSKKKL